MKEKIQKQEAFIQIPILIAVIVSIVIVAGVGGTVLYKQGKLAPLTTNISEIFKGANESIIIDSKKEIVREGSVEERLSANIDEPIKKEELKCSPCECPICPEPQPCKSKEIIKEVIREVPVEKIVYKEICSCPPTQRESSTEKNEKTSQPTEQWISPVSAIASGYTKWGETWYTGPPEFAIDGNSITSWTLNSMGEIIFDLGNTKIIKGINAYLGGHVTNGNTVNVFVDDTQVLYNEKFGATSNKRYFNPLQGRYIKYQTVPLPHNEYLQIATWSEIAEFEVLIESE